MILEIDTDDVEDSDHILDNLDPVESMAVEMYFAAIKSGKITPQVDVEANFAACVAAMETITSVLISKRKAEQIASAETTESANVKHFKKKRVENS